jgi:hypothetical protein
MVNIKTKIITYFIHTPFSSLGITTNLINAPSKKYDCRGNKIQEPPHFCTIKTAHFRAVFIITVRYLGSGSGAGAGSGSGAGVGSDGGAGSGWGVSSDRTNSLVNLLLP